MSPLASSEVVENHIRQLKERRHSNEMRERMEEREKEREKEKERKQGKRKEGQKHEFIFSFYEYGVFHISSLCFLVWGLLDQNERD